MADLDYTSALGDLNFAPAENYYGIGAQSIAQALPSLTNPYASPLSNLGVTLGGALVASLLGYQARKEANDLSLQTQRYANQLLRAETPEARVSFLESLPSDVLESGVGTRLSRLSTALAQQQAVQNALIGQEVAKKKALAEFELGPEGSKLFERQQTAELQKALALRQPTAEPGLPAGVQERIVESSVFADSAKAHRDRIAKMSPSELKTLLATGTSFFGLVGDPGFIQENEAILQQYRKANFGATLTGQEKKAADIISGKSLTASKDDILAAWDTLIDQSKKRAVKTVDVASKSRSQIASMFEPPVETKETEAQKRNRELKERLAKLEALAAQRK